MNGYDVDLQLQYREVGATDWTYAVPITDAKIDAAKTLLVGSGEDQNNCFDYLEDLYDRLVAIEALLAGVAEATRQIKSTVCGILQLPFW